MMTEGRACVPCEHLEVSGSEQSEHEVLLCQTRFHWSREPAETSVGADPLQAILAPTITAISEWKRFKESNKHHAWLNVARLNETVYAFDELKSGRDINNESDKQRAAFRLYVVAVKAFVETLNQMTAQEAHHTLRHPVHGTPTLDEYLKTQAMTDELEHICNLSLAYVQTL